MDNKFNEGELLPPRENPLYLSAADGGQMGSLPAAAGAAFGQPDSTPAGAHKKQIITGHQDDRDTQQAKQTTSNSNNSRTTDAQTMMHILKANIGTGVLAMPSAFKNVGLWTGFVLVPLIGYICIHCMNILITSHNHLCDRFNYESLDYDQVASLSLACGPKWIRRYVAKRAHVIVTVFLILTQVGFCCVYIMFVIENLQLAMLNLLNLQYSTTVYLLIVFPIIGLTSCTSNLKTLARISTTANVLQLIGLALIFFDLLQFHTFSHNYAASNNGTEQALNVSREREIRIWQFLSPDLAAGLPLFFATAVYAFEGIGVVLPVIKEMKHPRRILGLNGVLNTSMALVAILYMAMGFFGYSKYGQYVQGSITLNLPDSMLNEIVRVTFVIAIGLSYSLQFYVPWTIIWPFIDESLFYSYRPRVARDKLEILNKLSAENKWDLVNVSQGTVVTCNSSIQSSATSFAIGGGSQNQAGSDLNNTTANNSCSNLSTCATSYICTSASRQSVLGCQSQYGSIAVGGQGQQLKLANREHRNRLEDVMELTNEQEIPDLEWRPPPSSMRGKRKLVRYTVILVTVSFTFVAAALIPRLDLFISLIGALASSCLAIIFPAIIQLCTFWNCHDETENINLEESKQQSGGALDVDADGRGRQNGFKLAMRQLRRKVSWHLFLLKNLFLILFGILGLITGGWISMSKLIGAVSQGEV